MVIQISVDPALGSQWSGQVERLINFELASLHSKIWKLNISLSAPSGPDTTFRCYLTATLNRGEKLTIETLNRSARVCVVDALARLRRTVVRDVMLQAV